MSAPKSINPELPKIELPLPNIMPNPINQKKTVVTQKTMTFFDRIFTAFFERHKPVSTIPKPRFIKNTRKAVIRTQTVSAANLASHDGAAGTAAASSAKAPATLKVVSANKISTT